MRVDWDELRRAMLVIYLARRKTVTRVTPPPAPLGDTAPVESSNTNGVRNMFTLNTFESNLTKFIAATTLAALVLSVFA